MADSQKWIVKDVEGKIWGPFAYDKLIRQIESSYYSGEELVATYPGGSWTKMSKRPEFYDKLLESLSNDHKTQIANRLRQASIDEETKPGIEEEVAGGRAVSDDGHDAEKKLELEDSKFQKSKSFSTESLAPKRKKGTKKTSISREDPPVIELKNLDEHIQSEKLKKLKMPVFIVVLASVVVVAAILIQPKDTRGKIHLVAPRTNQEKLSPEKVNEKIKKSVANFQRDIFSGYVAAENDLVEIIEANPKNINAMQLLCLTYRELWPYAFQDSQDLATISKMVREAKRVDISSLDGAVCEIVNNLVNDRSEQAAHLTDAWLQLQPGVSVLYDIKGELLLLGKDYLTATPYFEKASELWPQWQKPYIQQARCLTQRSIYPQALDFYRKVLSNVRNHGIAKIEMGLLEVSLFQHYDRASELINSGINSSEKVPGSVQSKGLMALANIDMQKGKKQSAIDLAKRAYAVNPSNMEAKAKLIQWAGMREFQSVKVNSAELIFTCEQFLRSGDYISAQAECKTAFEKDHTQGVAALKAAQALWQLNQSTEAIAWAQKAIQADSRLVEAYVSLADFFSQRYDFESAAKVLQSAFSLMPKRYEIMRGFAQIEVRRNDFKGAENYADKALKIYDADSDTFLIMAEAKIGLGKYNETKNFVSRAIEVDSTNADAQSLFAKVLVGLEGAASGESYLNDLVTNYPRQNKYRMALAEVYTQDESFAQAEGILRQVISLDQENKKAIISLGKVLRALNRNNEALEQFFLAGVKDPNDANPIFLAGQLYFDTGKYTEAERQFSQVLKQNPRFPLAHFQKGRALLQLGRAKEALDEARYEQALNPNLSEGYILAAESDYALRQFTACATEFQKAVAKSPQTSEVYVKMARCNRRSGSLDAALSLLREAESKESGNPDLYKELGAIYQTKAMAEEALKAYDRYLALLPGAPDRGQVEAQMRRIESGETSLAPDAF
jgi:tetratricopeptide (TPR) repeat protein